MEPEKNLPQVTPQNPAPQIVPPEIKPVEQKPVMPVQPVVPVVPTTLAPQKSALQSEVENITAPKPKEVPKPLPPDMQANGKFANMFKSLRTYQGDIDEILKKGKTSVSSIVVAEQKRKETILEAPKIERRTEIKNKSFFVLGILLLLLGISAIVGVLYYMGGQNKVILMQQSKTVMGFSKEKDLVATDLSRDALLSAISKANMSFDAPLNSILFLNTADASSTPISAVDLFSALAPNIPQSLARALNNPYMIGVYATATNTPFMIFTTNDYAASFAGMLKWEPGMISDLGQVFSLPQQSTTTPYVWSDEALQNKDLRIIKGADGKTILLYSFIDRNTLVIAQNENIFTAVLNKYLISKTIR